MNGTFSHTVCLHQLEVCEFASSSLLQNFGEVIRRIVDGANPISHRCFTRLTRVKVFTEPGQAIIPTEISTDVLIASVCSLVIYDITQSEVELFFKNFCSSSSVSEKTQNIQQNRILFILTINLSSPTPLGSFPKDESQPF
jgi:hypothetical protein